MIPDYFAEVDCDWLLDVDLWIKLRFHVIVMTSEAFWASLSTLKELNKD